MAKTSVTIDFIVVGIQIQKAKEPDMELFMGDQKYKEAKDYVTNQMNGILSDEVIMITKKQITIKLTGFGFFKKEAK